ncbi:ROK family protein [Nonomuraea ferruginea]
MLRFVREHAPCSRADIAANTGLNKATVSSLVADLIDRRLVRETGLTENRVGRPATMLVLDGSPYAAIGVEINVDYVAAVATDLAGQRLLAWRRSFSAGESVNQGVANVAAVVRRVVNRMAKEERQVLGLAVAVPGLVDVQGTVRIAPNLGWRDADIGGDLAKALRDPGFSIQVDNDANLAALAEQRFGGNAGGRRPGLPDRADGRRGGRHPRRAAAPRRPRLQR